MDVYNALSRRTAIRQIARIERAHMAAREVWRTETVSCQYQEVAMSTQGIADFTDAELETIGAIVERRYGTAVSLELADSELRIDPASAELALCPTVFWNQRGCSFVIFKLGENRYRCQFYYSLREQYGTGIPEFDDLVQCATVLLQLQADHEAQRQGLIPKSSLNPDRNN